MLKNNIEIIVKLVEDFCPLDLQESYDNAGWQVKTSSSECTGVLFSLDVTEGVLDEAIGKGYNLIIAHHPLIFVGLKKIGFNTATERIIRKAILNNVGIYAAHTNLDHVKQGVNAKICEKLKLQNTKILQPIIGKLFKLITFAPTNAAENVRNALFNAGAGNLGNYSKASFNSEGIGTFEGNEFSNPNIGNPNKFETVEEQKIEVIFEKWNQSAILKALFESHPYEEAAYDIIPLSNAHAEFGAGMIGELEYPTDVDYFLEVLAEQFNTNGIRHTAKNNTPVKRIAVCGGSGSFLLKAAKSAKADVFVTADFKYHQFFEAENEILIADIGHYESEQFTSEILYDVIAKKIPNFAGSISQVNTNPIKYFSK